MVVMQSFEENIKERLTKDIGTLIPDEALTALIEKAVHNCFFEPQKKQTFSGYSTQTITIPSVFEETVKDLLEENVKTVLRKWINDNEQKVLLHLKTFMESSAEDAFKKAVFGAFNDHFESGFLNYQNL